MKLHRIDLDPAPRGRAFWAYEGRRQGESSEPLLAAARWLLSEGLAKPGDRVTTYRGEMLCLTALVGVAARLTVAEEARGGLTFRRWRPITARAGAPCAALASEDARNARAGGVVADTPKNAPSTGAAPQ